LKACILFNFQFFHHVQEKAKALKTRSPICYVSGCINIFPKCEYCNNTLELGIETATFVGTSKKNFQQK
jgi:hypothetical protein